MMARFRFNRFDELGLRRALSDRMLPFLVGAMAFLAGLALAGWMGVAAVTWHWEEGAGSALTVMVPHPNDPDASGTGTRMAAVRGQLLSEPGILAARDLTEDEINALLRPWLGAAVKDLTVSIPAVIAARFDTAGPPRDYSDLGARLALSAPGTVLEDEALWAGQLARLARGFQLCAALVVSLVVLVTAAVIAVATRAGLAARREAILIVHQLGATDGYIAGRFAARAALLAGLGGGIGGLFALPVVFGLAALGQPLARTGALAAEGAIASSWFWLLPVVLLLTSAGIGYAAAQVTMRRWLRRLT